MILEIFMASSGSGLKKAEYDILLSAVPQDKRQQIEMQKIKHNADNTLIGIALVMAGISKTFSVPLGNISIGYKEDGKPIVKSPEGIHISISHSKDLVVCAVSDMPVGIDTEKIRAYNPGVAEKVFLSKQKMSDSLYTKEWTKVEAALKLKGTKNLSYRDRELFLGIETESVLYDGYWITAAYGK